MGIINGWPGHRNPLQYDFYFLGTIAVDGDTEFREVRELTIGVVGIFWDGPQTTHDALTFEVPNAVCLDTHMGCGLEEEGIDNGCLTNSALTAEVFEEIHGVHPCGG